MFKSSKRKSYAGKKLQDKILELRQFYLPMNLNYAFHNTKVNCIKKLNYLLKHCSRRYLQDIDFEEVVICALTLVYYFGMRLKLRKKNSLSRCWFNPDNRQFHRAEVAFQKTLDLLMPERSEVTMKVTFQFFSEIFLWPFESFVGQILEVILYFDRGKTTLFNLMLTDIHYVLFSDITSARHRMRVLYDLLESDNWIIEKQNLLPFVTRLLDFFAFSLTQKDNKVYAYKYLRKGFEVCLRRIFERADNNCRLTVITTMLNWFAMVDVSDDDDVLQFSSLLDHAAKMYKVGSYIESFREGLFEHILNHFVSSSNSLYSLIGCRLLQRFLDRQHNSPYLIAPTIFYEFSKVDLKIAVYDSSDKAFIQQHRELFHKCIFNAIKLHAQSTVIMKSLFSIICSIVLEVPCALTAATTACLLMVIQDFALHDEKISDISRYWLHAIVISVMSLVCWVHKATVLYSYMNQIIQRRAKFAPQLNPPLIHTYKVGQQQVMWNKPHLFIEDWELRYGLWKHFQDKQPKVSARWSVMKKKVPTMDVSD